MPQYRFTHSYEHVLHGLAHGINAIVEHVAELGDQLPELPPEGSTVVGRPGDLITTTEPYPHAWMVNTVTGEPDQPEAAETATDGSAPPEVSDSADSSDSADTAPGSTPTSDTAPEE